MDVKRHIDVIRVNPQDWPDGTPAWKAETPELGHDVIPAGRYRFVELRETAGFGLASIVVLVAGSAVVSRRRPT